MVECPISKRANEVVVGLARGNLQPEERPERVMEYVLGFRMAEPQSAAVQHHFRRALVIKARRPIGIPLGRGFGAVRGHFNR